MPSGTLSSNQKSKWFYPALFRKNLTRFWPLWVGYGLCWLFMLPFVMISVTDRTTKMEAVVHAAYENVLIRALPSIPSVGLCYGGLVAAALFSYLMNNRSAGMFHVLPVRREGLFFTNVVSALAMIAGPTLVVALVILAAPFSVRPDLIFLWFGVNLVVTFMFFAFALCCAMFTGRILAAPVFYAILNYLVIGVCYLLYSARVLLASIGDFWLMDSAFTRWCTPAYYLTDLLHFQTTYDELLKVSLTLPPEGRNVLIAVCYSLAHCCVFLAIAILVYRRRQLERTGDVVTVGWVRPVFQYGVGVCVGLALGGYLCEASYYTYTYYTYMHRWFTSWHYIGFVVLGSLVGSFGARMLLKKSFRVFRDWKGPVILAACMALLMGSVKMDVLGLQRKVPDAAEVEAVILTTYGTHGAIYLYADAEDPHLVAEITALHKALFTDYSRLDWLKPYDGNYMEDEEGFQIAGDTGVDFLYLMRDGRYISREYSVPIFAEEFGDPNSYAARLQALISTPKSAKDSCSDGYSRGENKLQLYTYWERDAQEARLGYIGKDGRITTDITTITTEEATRLWEAFLEDLDAGRVRQYLLKDQEMMENCYDNFLTFEGPARSDADGIYHYSADGSLLWSVSIIPQKSMTSLMAALEELGLSDCLSQWNCDETIPSEPQAE